MDAVRVARRGYRASGPRIRATDYTDFHGLFEIGVVWEATACHVPLRRAYTSRNRYSPLMSIVFFEFGIFDFPFLITPRPVTNALFSSSTVTFGSRISHESIVTVFA